jgi:hypothetical protein
MASNLLATYSPYDVTLSIVKGSFQHILSGFSEQTIVTVSRDSDSFTKYTGADNSPTRIFIPNTSGTLVVPLQQTSPSNDMLQLLYDEDVRTRDSSGLFSVFLKDNSGRSLYHAYQAYISKVPDSSFGTEMQIREWQIHAIHLESYIGGNSPFDPADAAAFEALGGVIEDRWRRQ